MPLDNTNDSGSTNNSNPEITALKNQVFVLLVALVVVTGSFAVYLYRQDSMLGKQYNQMSATMDQDKNAIGTFVQQLVMYGQKHPEFAPVLKKYNLPTGSLPTGPNLPPSSTIPGK